MSEPDPSAEPTTAPHLIASLEHLTGATRNQITWIDAARVDLMLRAGRFLRDTDPPDTPNPDTVVRLEARPEGYALQATSAVPIWVNRHAVEQALLAHHDIVEFGERGPIARFRIFQEVQTGPAPVNAILSDAAAYLRNSRRPIGRRILWAFGDLARRLTWQTTLLFRLSVLVALAVLGLVVWQQIALSRQFELRIAAEAARLESVAAALSRAREEALRGADLAQLRAELTRGILSNDERLALLERRSEASARVILDSLASVAFLQGAYGFRDPQTGKVLRHQINADGQPLIGPRGQPLLMLGGEGPAAELQFTGTGFLIEGSGALVTNRHVALPWETNLPNMPGMAQLEPVTLRFLAWFPHRTEALPVRLLRASDAADLALVGPADDARPFPDDIGLALARAASRPGQTVILMGYPTGLRSLLAQAGPAFLETLQASGEADFWRVASRLAEAGHILPLSSRGIVGQLTTSAMVYDAETTHGGSGGPVLDLEGRVVAVNSAILPEFGGSNLGVPIMHVRALLAEAGLLAEPAE
ncbi:MAG: serine protease [Pseudomonadota bacterium]